jgi:hypothetical protein
MLDAWAQDPPLWSMMGGKYLLVELSTYCGNSCPVIRKGRSASSDATNNLIQKYA